MGEKESEKERGDFKEVLQIYQSHKLKRVIKYQKRGHVFCIPFLKAESTAIILYSAYFKDKTFVSQY